MSKKNVIRCRFRLYPGRDDDLITWWKSLNDLPYGGKGQTIKDVLRKGLGISEPGSTGAGELGGSIPAQDNLLLDIRRVVEAAVTEVLNQGHVEVRMESETSTENRNPDDTARVDELMAEMQRNLLLPEDEDDL
jgi:hypothetical protein